MSKTLREITQLDEISKTKVFNAADKLAIDLKKTHAKAKKLDYTPYDKMTPEISNELDKTMKHMEKRYRQSDTFRNKIAGQNYEHQPVKVPATGEHAGFDFIGRGIRAGYAKHDAKVAKIQARRKLKEEQLDELKDATLRNYVSKARKDQKKMLGGADGYTNRHPQAKKIGNRGRGIQAAKDRIYYSGKANRVDNDYKFYRKEETEMNETDTISLTVPLFIRMLEFAKEDAKTDMDLHKATENILDMQDDDVLDMDSYEDIVDINEGQLDEAKRKGVIWGDAARKRHKDASTAWQKKWETMSDDEKQKYKDKAFEYHYTHPIKKKLTNEGIDEGVKIKRKVGRADIKTAGDLSREKRERSNVAKAAIKRMKESGKKIRFQSFGRWDSKRKSAREKMED
jgi:hypothetical protein